MAEYDGNLWDDATVVPYYLNPNGTLAPATANYQERTTPPIEASPGDVFRIRAERTDESGLMSWYAFCFYDASGETIGTRRAAYNPKASDEGFESAAPEGTASFRASAGTYGSAVVTLELAGGGWLRG